MLSNGTNYATGDHRISVFGDTVESCALARVLSILCGPAGFYDLSECITHISKLLKAGRANSGNGGTMILHDSRRLSRPTHLIDILYELRFSVGWLGPLLVLACPEGIEEVESTELFRMSGDDDGPVPQRCVASSLPLGVLLTALSMLDGYDRCLHGRGSCNAFATRT